MSFELRSADFRITTMSSSLRRGGAAAGLLINFKGAKSGSAEAKARGLNVHLESQTFMGFKATTPVTLKRSDVNFSSRLAGKNKDTCAVAAFGVFTSLRPVDGFYFQSTSR